jgi:hypothetical protein
MASGERAPEGRGKNKKGGAAERASKLLRDINILGALAIGGAAIIAPPVLAAPLGVWAGINAAQAAGFEAARRHVSKRRKKGNGQQSA